MRILRVLLTGAIVLAVTVTFVQPAAAANFEWGQNAGFDSTTGNLRAGAFFGNNPTPRVGHGGLEFSGDQNLPVDTDAPDNTYSLVQWGCQADGNNSAGVTNCVNGGTVANVEIADENFPLGAGCIDPPLPAAPTCPGRSALRLFVFSSTGHGSGSQDKPPLVSILGPDPAPGDLVTIARIEHLNRVIDNEANTLEAVTVAANLVVDATPQVTNSNTVDITFLETNNVGACPTLNPLGSQCDDFFTFAGDFANVEFEHNGQTFFLQFRLTPPDDCVARVPQPFPATTIVVYDCPTPTPHPIAIDFPGGRAWAPEGFDSAILVKMFVTEEPIAPPAAKFLIIDEDSIDNGIRFFCRPEPAADGQTCPAGGPTLNTQNIFPGTKFQFTDIEVNDQKASYTMHDVLQFFIDNVGQTIALHTGQTGDEGWFAPNCVPRKWLTNGSISNGNTCLTPGTEDFNTALGRFINGQVAQSKQDKINDVRPLRGLGLEMLEGQTVCAVVYDSDIGINYADTVPHQNGNLQGARLGIVAFKVLVGGVNKMNQFSSSTVPEAQILILDAGPVCGAPLELFAAPIPKSSSVPNDINPHSTADDNYFPQP